MGPGLNNFDGSITPGTVTTNTPPAAPSGTGVHSVTIGDFTVYDTASSTGSGGCGGVGLVDTLANSNYYYTRTEAPGGSGWSGNTDTTALTLTAGGTTPATGGGTAPNSPSGTADDLFQSVVVNSTGNAVSEITGVVGDLTYGSSTPYHCQDVGGVAGT